jgi:hypothetical protein
MITWMIAVSLFVIGLVGNLSAEMWRVSVSTENYYTQKEWDFRTIQKISFTTRTVAMAGEDLHPICDFTGHLWSEEKWEIAREDGDIFSKWMRVSRCLLCEKKRHKITEELWEEIK